MKIIIAGAGIGGLAAAEQFGRMGFHVTVYEQAESLNAMRYDWHDDVKPDVFRELALEIPAEHFPKKAGLLSRHLPPSHASSTRMNPTRTFPLSAVHSTECCMNGQSRWLRSSLVPKSLRHLSAPDACAGWL